MANIIPPWAATFTLLDNRLMTLDKCLGIWLMVISKIWRWLLAKCVLKVSGAKAKNACNNA